MSTIVIKLNIVVLELVHLVVVLFVNQGLWLHQIETLTLKAGASEYTGYTSAKGYPPPPMRPPIAHEWGPEMPGDGILMIGVARRWMD